MPTSLMDSFNQNSALLTQAATAVQASQAMLKRQQRGVILAGETAAYEGNNVTHLTRRKLSIKDKTRIQIDRVVLTNLVIFSSECSLQV